MSDKYASLSPYTYCADNPVRLMDPNGEDIYPDNSFIGTTYEKVHNYLLNNNRSYSKACESFVSKKVFNLYLNCNRSAIPEGCGGFTKYSSHFKPVGDPGIYPGVQQVPTDAVSTESFHPDKSKGDISLWHFYIVIHEMGHTSEALNYKAANNRDDHGGFMILIDNQINMWNDLNNALNLGLSSTQITELSMYGAEGSSYFNRYINDMVLKNGTTKEKEIEAYRQRIEELFEKNRTIKIPDLDQ